MQKYIVKKKYANRFVQSVSNSYYICEPYSIIQIHVYKFQANIQNSCFEFDVDHNV